MSQSPDDVARAALQEASTCLLQSLEKIEHCVRQLSTDQLWWRPEPSLNSIGNLVLHLTGNLRQWILSGLGGAPDLRDRPSEFSEQSRIPASRLLDGLTAVVTESLCILADQSAAEMSQIRRVQGFERNGWAVLFDTVPHFKGHTQEITCLTRMQKGASYEFHWQPQTPEQGAPSPA